MLPAVQVGILQKMQTCRNTVRLLGCYETNDEVMVVTGLCSGGDLQKLSDVSCCSLVMRRPTHRQQQWQQQQQQQQHKQPTDAKATVAGLSTRKPAAMLDLALLLQTSST